MQRCGSHRRPGRGRRHVIGAIAVRDELRPEAADVIATLRADGYEVVMLTGDNLPPPPPWPRSRHRRRPRRAAARGQVDERRASCAGTPDGDGRRRRQRRPGAGHRRPWHCDGRHGHRRGHRDRRRRPDGRRPPPPAPGLRSRPSARSIMLQNVGLSLALITILIPLAALFGVLGLAAVVLVHELAEVVVIANGVRAGHESGVLAANARRHTREPVPQQRSRVKAANSDATASYWVDGPGSSAWRAHSTACVWRSRSSPTEPWRRIRSTSGRWTFDSPSTLASRSVSGRTPTQRSHRGLDRRDHPRGVRLRAAQRPELSPRWLLWDSPLSWPAPCPISRTAPPTASSPTTSTPAGIRRSTSLDVLITIGAVLILLSTLRQGDRDNTADTEQRPAC